MEQTCPDAEALKPLRMGKRIDTLNESIKVVLINVSNPTKSTSKRTFSLCFVLCSWPIYERNRLTLDQGFRATTLL